MCVRHSGDSQPLTGLLLHLHPYLGWAQMFPLTQTVNRRPGPRVQARVEGDFPNPAPVSLILHSSWIWDSLLIIWPGDDVSLKGAGPFKVETFPQPDACVYFQPGGRGTDTSSCHAGTGPAPPRDTTDSCCPSGGRRFSNYYFLIVRNVN